jgi:Co/Zn/Cd efflux system component
MGNVGAVLVSRWSWGLLLQTSDVLLDGQASAPLLASVQSSIEQGTGGEVMGLHVWEIAPGRNAAAICVSGPAGLSPEACRAAIPSSARIAHATIEVVRSGEGSPPRPRRRCDPG